METSSSSSAANYLQRTSKELLHTWLADDSFQYQPLPGPSHIRLLRLQPGRPNDEISCSIRTVSLDDNPKYTALSYTWRKQHSYLRIGTTMAVDMVKAAYRKEEYDLHYTGAEEQVRTTKTILCNGKRLGVTSNLYDALLSFRQTRPGNGEYWIDAVCMNQSDLTERNAQVRMMGRIYQSADLVLVWLGNCSSSLARGLPELEALARKPPSELPPFDLFPEDKTSTAGASSGLFSLFKDDWSFISAPAMAAFDLSNRHWFKRIWVLQEFFLAKELVFLYGKHQVSLQALLTAFIWAYQNPGKAVKPAKESWDIARAYIMPRWFSHTCDFPSVLLARETITQGRKLTLREWLLTCRGHNATDSRDFVFGGLSLIHPASLRIDKLRLQPGEYACSNRRPPPLPPRPGTRAHNSNQPIVERPAAVEGVSPSSVPLPKGLWRFIEVDYKASEAEVLVNLAACLLSQNEPHNLDLLSIAAHPREPKDPLNVLLKVKPSRTPDLPSWVPALGSWTSRVSSNLATAPAAAGGGGTVFAAGTLGQLPAEIPSPTISRDGTTLYLDAMPLDSIEGILLDAEFSYSEKYISVLIPFLEKLAALPCTYPSDVGTSFNAVATALASSSSGATEVGSLADKNMDRSPSSLPPELRARVWLCEIIEREVRHWVTSLRMDIKAFPLQKGHRVDKQRQLERLLVVYRELVRKFNDLPWSGAADQGRPRPGKSDGGEQKKGRREQIMESLRNKIVEKIPGPFEHILRDSMEPISPEAQRYENAFYSAMNWRCLFRTKDGLIGMGPSWLECGDSVMLIRGAIVPYVFRHVDVDLRLQVESLGDTLEELEERLFEWKTGAKKQHRLSVVDTEREIASLKQKIAELHAQVGRKDAWVLIGEAYVEGVMRGEALERAGVDSFERIAIV